MSGATSGIINDASALYSDAGSVDSFNSRTGAVVPITGDYAAFYVPYTGANANVNLGVNTLRAGGFLSSDGSAGITVTIVTAQLTPATGTQGSMSFKNGLLVSSVAAT